MKKRITMALCATLLAGSLLTGCSADTLKYGKAGEWTKEGKEMLGTEITDGNFVLYGVEYKFPMQMSDFLENGWHIANSISNKDKFELDAYYTSEDFKLYRDDDNKAYITVSAYNDSDAPAKLESCMLYSVEIDPEVVEAVFPGGISRISKGKEINYSGAVSVEGNVSVYNFTAVDGYSSTVTITASSKLNSVKYAISDEFMGWVSSDEGLQEYVENLFAVEYHGELDKYTAGSPEDAKELYDMQIRYLASSIIYYCDCDSTYLSEETIALFDEIAVDVLKTSSWEITVNSFDADTQIGNIDIIVTPTNFFNEINDAIIAAATEYNTKYADVDFNTITDDEFAVLEEDYAQMLYNELKAVTPSITTAEPIKLSYNCYQTGDLFTDEEIAEIDDAIMGFSSIQQ